MFLRSPSTPSPNVTYKSKGDVAKNCTTPATTLENSGQHLVFSLENTVPNVSYPLLLEHAYTSNAPIRL